MDLYGETKIIKSSKSPLKVNTKTEASRFVILRYRQTVKNSWVKKFIDEGNHSMWKNLVKAHLSMGETTEMSSSADYRKRS